jgi:hypothetical protein
VAHVVSWNPYIHFNGVFLPGQIPEAGLCCLLLTGINKKCFPHFIETQANKKWFVHHGQSGLHGSTRLRHSINVDKFDSLLHCQ